MEGFALHCWSGSSESSALLATITLARLSALFSIFSGPLMIFSATIVFVRGLSGPTAAIESCVPGRGNSLPLRMSVPPSCSTAGLPRCS